MEYFYLLLNAVNFFSLIPLMVAYPNIFLGVAYYMFVRGCIYFLIRKMGFTAQEELYHAYRRPTRPLFDRHTKAYLDWLKQRDYLLQFIYISLHYLAVSCYAQFLFTCYLLIWPNLRFIFLLIPFLLPLAYQWSIKQFFIKMFISIFPARVIAIEHEQPIFARRI